MAQRRRVLVVDGSKYFDNLIWRMLIPESEFEIVGLARNADEALEMAIALFPDIILVDLSHSEVRGLWAIKALHAAQSATPIIAFTPMSSHEYTQAALDAGATACFAKSEMVDVLLQTIWRLIPARSSVPGHLSTQGTV
jgi:DNA-binding NarL/FixJ family response regulator